MQNSNTNDREVVDESTLYNDIEVAYKDNWKSEHEVDYDAEGHPHYYSNLNYEPKFNYENFGKDVEQIFLDYQSQQQSLPLTDDELEKCQDEYIKLLIDELDELVGMAAVHGWRSTRFEKGVELRSKIANAKANRGSYTLEDEDIEKPVLIGTLTKPFGLNEYIKAEVGHEVYSLKDRYIIYLKSDKYPTIEVPFYKETLQPYIASLKIIK